MHKNRLIKITPRARDDLKNIGRYTERNWGKAQRNQYLKNIDTRVKWLAQNPLSGKHRTDIREGYYSYREGQHVVFYQLTDDTIHIIGIPHKEMDTLKYFSAP